MMRVCVMVLCVVLAACSRTPVPSVPEPAAVEAPARASLQQRVERVRGEAAQGQGLDVMPVRDPEVEDLRQAAAQAEARGDLATAADILERALLLSPDSPELLQESAEVALLGGDINTAIERAGRAYLLGPQVGSLCRRSWGTMREAYEEAGHDEGVDIAVRKIEDCTVAGPVRM